VSVARCPSSFSPALRSVRSSEQSTKDWKKTYQGLVPFVHITCGAFRRPMLRPITTFLSVSTLCFCIRPKVSFVISRISRLLFVSSHQRKMSFHPSSCFDTLCEVLLLNEHGGRLYAFWDLDGDLEYASRTTSSTACGQRSLHSLSFSFVIICLYGWGNLSIRCCCTMDGRAVERSGTCRMRPKCSHIRLQNKSFDLH
jgi:hypothetical protein